MGTKSVGINQCFGYYKARNNDMEGVRMYGADYFAVNLKISF